VAVYVAFAGATVVFLRPVIPEQMALLLAGAAAFALIGLVDDLRNAGPWKLAVEGGVVAAIVWMGGFRVNLPWPYLGEILAVLWIVGVANAVNCLDCTDGVAAGATVICALALVPVAVMAHRWGVAVGAAAVAGASLGFLPYNFPPARIFLGDAGSLMVGFLLAALSATIAAPGASPTSFVAPVLILGLPCCDFLFVHWRRYHNGARDLVQILTSTGKDHLPHRLQQAGLSYREVALWIYVASALLGMSAVLLAKWGTFAAILLAMLLVVTAASVGWSAGITHESRGGVIWGAAGRAKRASGPP
jgi:UDP-GlcNAc:undecaprenyl-phosphate/decaprenyl-phosphate GlcNAc-1-phosphate transferase